MKKLMIVLLLIPMASAIFGQKYYSKKGVIEFSSDAPLEKIEAHNAKASTVFDLESGAIEWAVLIKGFDFEKALMQEHFNENYMESSKYPKAKFKGKFMDAADLDLTQAGRKEVAVKGNLTIHGVEKEIETMAVFEVGEGGIVGTSSVTILVADYGIEIPAVVKDNIAKEVVISIEANYELLPN